MKLYLSIAAVLLLLIGFLIWRSLPEQVLKRRSKALIEMADQMTSGAGLFDYKRLEGLVADTLEYRVEAVSAESGIAHQADVLSAYRWMSENVRKSEFEVDQFIGMVINEDQARVECRVKGILEMSEMQMLEGTHRVELGWAKDPRGDWRLEKLILE